MKKFNKVITIEVAVDSIAEQLLSTLSPDFKHRELVVEAIIGAGVDKNTLSYVYNALNGFSPEIDFKVGDVVRSEHTEWMYPTEESRTKRNSVSTEIGECKVIAIDLFTKDKLKVEYVYQNIEGKTDLNTTWVSHTKCSKVPVSI